MSFKRRTLPESNYSAVFVGGKTVRIPIDSSAPITELDYPEFYDVAINSKCYGGCPYCYTCATTEGDNFQNVPQKIEEFFGGMSVDQRPFQVALGGAGEPTLHPEFVEILSKFQELGITPNYTTNGMHLSQEILAATKELCGGVAITLHPHLETTWRRGIEKLLAKGIRTNTHVVISDKTSIDRCAELYHHYHARYPKNGIEYFVLLPYMNVGFATGENEREIDTEHLSNWLDSVHQNGDIAFGSNFYHFLREKGHYGVSLYPPEILSKYLVMDDHMSLYTNSFDNKLWFPSRVLKMAA
jgi:sulfatase maturation enzyme AslB (radical SAM superfamily)